MASGDPRPQTPKGGSGWELSMVARRLGTQSHGLPSLGRARDRSPDREKRLRWDGAAARHWLTHQKVRFKKLVLTCGQRWLLGAGLGTSNV